MYIVDYTINCITCQFNKMLMICYSNRGLVQWWKPTERYPTVFAACLEPLLRAKKFEELIRE